MIGRRASNVATEMTTKMMTSIHHSTFGMNETINAISAPRENQIDTNDGPSPSIMSVATNNTNQMIHVYCSIMI